MSDDTVDGSEIRRENHLTCMKPVVIDGTSIISTGDRRISEPSTVCLPFGLVNVGLVTVA